MKARLLIDLTENDIKEAIVFWLQENHQKTAAEICLHWNDDAAREQDNLSAVVRCKLLEDP